MRDKGQGAQSARLDVPFGASPFPKNFDGAPELPALDPSRASDSFLGHATAASAGLRLNPSPRRELSSTNRRPWPVAQGDKGEDHDNPRGTSGDTARRCR